jgi:hypothetical protein
MIATPVVQLGRMNLPETTANAATTSETTTRRRTARSKCFMAVHVHHAGTEGISSGSLYRFSRAACPRHQRTRKIQPYTINPGAIRTPASPTSCNHLDPRSLRSGFPHLVLASALGSSPIPLTAPLEKTYA